MNYTRFFPKRKEVFPINANKFRLLFFMNDTRKPPGVFLREKLELVSEFSAVLAAQLIGTLTAAQSCIGALPKPFRIHHNAKLPHKPCGNGHNNQAHGKKATHKNQGREHHQMIPVKDPAGRTAPCLHHQSERTPNQNADQIADIKRY